MSYSFFGSLWLNFLFCSYIYLLLLSFRIIRKVIWIIKLFVILIIVFLDSCHRALKTVQPRVTLFYLAVVPHMVMLTRLIGRSICFLWQKVKAGYWLVWIWRSWDLSWVQRRLILILVLRLLLTITQLDIFNIFCYTGYCLFLFFKGLRVWSLGFWDLFNCYIISLTRYYLFTLSFFFH